MDYINYNTITHYSSYNEFNCADTYKNNRINMFTIEEITQINSMRTGDNPTKNEVFTLKAYKNRILKSLNQGEEARECFCAKPRRRQYKAEFYAYFDNYINTPMI